MTNLTKCALEDVLAEIQSSGLALSILPTKMYLRQDVVAELARERGISTEEMLSVIRRAFANWSAGFSGTNRNSRSAST